MMNEARSRGELILAILFAISGICFLLSFTDIYWYIYDVLEDSITVLFLVFIYGHIEKFKNIFKFLFISILTLSIVNIMFSFVTDWIKICNRNLPTGEIEAIISQNYHDYALKFSVPFVIFIAVILWKSIIQKEK